MQISNNLSLSNIASTIAKDLSQAATKATSLAKQLPQDQVSISSLASQIASDPSKLSQLQQAFENGTYNVSPAQIAQSLISSMMG